MLSHLLSLQHADASFPSGGFAFSNGVEGMAALGPLDEAALGAIMRATILHRWAGTDRVALIHAHRAAGDLDALARIDRRLEAATLAEALREGSRRNGRSLLVSHGRLGTPGAAILGDAVRAGRLLGHVAMVQGTLWRALGLDESAAVAISGYQAVAGLATAAVRLGQVGAIEAQRLVATLLPLVATLAADPLDVPVREGTSLAGADVPEDESGPVLTSFVPLLEIATARHVQTGLRLFSN